MKVHIENPLNTDMPITAAQWEDACGRHEILTELRVSIGASPTEFTRAVKDADILLTWVDIVRDRLAGEDFRAIAPKLKVIHCNAAGVDRLLPLSWLPDGVQLINNSGTQSDKVGEFVAMALLMLHNHLPSFIQAQSEGAWRPITSTSIRDRRLCIVGVGAIGSAIARQARAFGMHVTGVRNSANPHPDFDAVFPIQQFDLLLPSIDDIVLACPLTPETRNLLSRDRLFRLREGARLINVARGGVWDENAVCDALDLGHLEYAFTDVASVEPLPPGHRLWRTKGMLVTPHISADDRSSYNGRTLDVLAANLESLCTEGAMPNRVDPVLGY